MSTKHFQTALAKVIADPETCTLYRKDPELLHRDYELTALEFNRLRYMIAQQGMKVNSMLYRMNRFTPLANFLPYTIKLLDEVIEETVGEFWSIHDKSPFQFNAELVQFAQFIRQKIADGSIDIPCLEDTLTFEEAYIDIRFRNMEAPVADASKSWSLHPSARLICMQYNPFQLLDALVLLTPGNKLPPIDKGERCYILKYLETIALTPIAEPVANYLRLGYPCDDSLFERLAAEGFIVASAARPYLG